MNMFSFGTDLSIPDSACLGRELGTRNLMTHWLKVIYPISRGHDPTFQGTWRLQVLPDLRGWGARILGYLFQKPKRMKCGMQFVSHRSAVNLRPVEYSS